jgi:PAS domain-containing protein
MIKRPAGGSNNLARAFRNAFDGQRLRARGPALGAAALMLAVLAGAVLGGGHLQAAIWRIEAEVPIQMLQVSRILALTLRDAWRFQFAVERLAVAPDQPESAARLTLATRRLADRAAEIERSGGLDGLDLGRLLPALRRSVQDARAVLTAPPAADAHPTARLKGDAGRLVALATRASREAGNLSLAGLAERRRRLDQLQASVCMLWSLGWLAIGGLALMVAWQHAARRSTARAQMQLRGAIGSIGDGFALWDGNRRLVLWNRRFTELYPELEGLLRPGMTMEEVGSTYVAGCAVKGLRAEAEAWLAERMRWRGEGAGRPVERRTPTGTWIRIAEALTAEGGLVSVQTDITTAKLREQELEESRARAARAEQRLREAIGRINDGFVLWDAEDRLVAHNRRYAELYAGVAPHLRPGITHDELVRHHLDEVSDPELRRRLEAWLAERRCRRRGELGPPYERQAPDGRWLRIGDYRTADGGLVSIHTDVTDVKRQEERLRASEDRYRALAERLPVPA